MMGRGCPGVEVTDVEAMTGSVEMCEYGEVGGYEADDVLVS